MALGQHSIRGADFRRPLWTVSSPFCAWSSMTEAASLWGCPWVSSGPRCRAMDAWTRRSTKGDWVGAWHAQTGGAWWWWWWRWWWGGRWWWWRWCQILADSVDDLDAPPMVSIIPIDCCPPLSLSRIRVRAGPLTLFWPGHAVSPLTGGGFLRIDASSGTVVNIKFLAFTQRHVHSTCAV